MSLPEFLQETENDRKRRQKQGRSSLFFRKKKDKGLNKVSSAINIGSKAENQGHKMSHHSHSVSSLPKSSISAPRSHTVPLPPPASMVGSNSNFYLVKNADFTNKNYDENDLGLHHEDTAGLLESEFMPGEEFAEGGGPAAIRDLGKGNF